MLHSHGEDRYKDIHKWEGETQNIKYLTNFTGESYAQILRTACFYLDNEEPF